MYKSKTPRSCGFESANPKTSSPPPHLPSRNEAGRTNHHNYSTNPPSMFERARQIMLIGASSCRLRTPWSRILFLLLCSPLLLPFLCATFPILCAAEVCIRLCRRRRKEFQKEEAEPLRRCEEGLCGDQEEEEVGLLQRYLEDQLMLVGSMYDCGDEFDDQNVDGDQIKSPLLG
ncbi:uncharacterized protein LOC119984018 [Tripterygium wilfordii]|nr:uncharacterized protein LOC119984018 [Tripterygium wilfordii]